MHQIKDLNSGTFGFVQLCLNKLTKEKVAIKFIERGEKVRYGILATLDGSSRRARRSPSTSSGRS